MVLDGIFGGPETFAEGVLLCGEVVHDAEFAH